ncbi:phenylalanine--tRNA ligase subunit beta [Gordonibacter massiliensis (ex Traore et al. 2017)]|uniref:phenylalanine--tRNA ligase subunit beta n=1 Tax=Gordonibacter massiliensis (ex Traore et al. 2017) TaxID=1841863 RepID=UPI001C8BAB9B|nr:phenylalanine--tRNA ligase subunit beta [Gordonibacter massiliensis (ex Traore et al. 2017)]MBX9033564.1 phenylalanine--tRNA ligase subunit beta [Gordonibacter massiliensis (ex Traore et al. 2017)]
MKVSLKWLSEYVDVPADTKAFCDRLDLTGTGVEAVEKTGAALDGVCVGFVETCEPHPDSDHMHVVTVDVGAGEPVQIVCGAPNIAAGIKVPVACVGAVLPGDFKIKKSKLRGVASSGMCCSGRELGLSGDHSGIMVLPEDAPVGMPIADYLKLADTVLDLEITPNRPDCLSMVGMAREVGAMYRADYASPLADMAAKLELDAAATPVDEQVKITIDDAVRCPRYTARVIRGCKVGPSPDWMVERLAAIGQRSINNIVDVTNYILFLFGQPLHAFDLAKLKNADGLAHIVVREAQDGERLTTLDGEDRELTSDMTVISTPELGAVALAGVMGGLDTEVTDETVDILLEAATFEPGRTSRTSRNLGLFSESSMRYERGVDDHGIAERSAAAAALMVEVAGGTVCAAAGNDDGIVDEWPAPSTPCDLRFRIPRFCAMMGADIPRADIADILARLGCTVSDDPAGDADVLAVVAPTFRPDLEREIDLYEEVLRLWGMDRIPATLPGGPGRVGTRSHTEHVLDTVNDVMRASGLNETMTYSFAEPDDLDRLRMAPEGLGEPVELINPLNADQSVMRQSIVPGLLRSVAYNQSRGVKNVQLYEMGMVFFAHEGRKQPKERRRLAGVLAGAMRDAGWNDRPAAFDFFDGKGVIESLARELALPKLRFKALAADEAPHLQPGRAAEVLSGGTVLGWVGELHPLAVDAFEADAPVVAFELDVEALAKASRPARDYVDVPSFPAVSMDVAFVVDEGVSHEKLVQCMSSAGGKLLEDARLFDVYRDEKRVGAGKKSMAYALTYRAADRTLTSDEVDKAHERLVKKVCGATGAEVRG